LKETLSCPALGSTPIKHKELIVVYLAAVVIDDSIVPFSPSPKHGTGHSRHGALVIEPHLSHPSIVPTKVIPLHNCEGYVSHTVNGWRATTQNNLDGIVTSLIPFDRIVY
jgi:hypothetical protein